MQSQAVTFDTHTFVKRLTRAGIPENQAEILAKEQSDLYERLVSKEHLAQKVGALELTLRNELEKLRADLKHELDQHKAANRQALKELELTLKHELEITKNELKRDIKEMEQKLTIKLGVLLGISVTILAALIKFFQARQPAKIASALSA